MGLDMNLYRKRYLSPFSDKEVVEKIEKLLNEKPVYILSEVAYWRKANQIREWFKNELGENTSGVVGGRVSTEQLKKLLDTVDTVLKSTELVEGRIKNGKSWVGTPNGGDWQDNYQDGKLLKNPKVAQKLLPTSEGFFFGSQEYDEYYWQDLEYTKKVLEGLLKDESGDEYEYSESW